METSWLITIISCVLTFLSNGGTVISWLFYRRQSLRLKNAEAFEKEVQVLRDEVATLRESVREERELHKQDREMLQKVLGENRALSNELSIAELKQARLRGAIGAAHECTKCDTRECPVMRKHLVNEQIYLTELKKKVADL